MQVITGEAPACGKDVQKSKWMHGIHFHDLGIIHSFQFIPVWLPTANSTWLWKITIFYGNTHYFYGHVQ